MSHIFLYSILSVVVVSLVSLIGLFSVPLQRISGKQFLTYLINFSAGALLGDVFIHLLPSLSEKNQFTTEISFWILGTIVSFFVLEKYLHWHYHAEDEGYGHSTHPLVYNILIGDSVHNFIDGLIIAGAYQADLRLGVATTLAVIMHEIPQEFGDFGSLIFGGFSRTKALLSNLLSATTAILGAIAAFMFTNIYGALPVLIAIGVGSFIYIAIADLIPQIHKEKEQSLTQLLSFGLGLVVMFALVFLE